MSDLLSADTGTAASVRPMTGAEYLESLRDGREVWINGERVDDVTTHPAFRNSARSVAALYDSLHDPAEQDVLLARSESGAMTHPFFIAPRSSEDLMRGRDGIVAWQRKVFGFMGRTPDYKGSFIGTLGANAGFYAGYEENARNLYTRAQDRVLYYSHALINPPIDRHLPAEETGGVVMHVEEETDNGLIVSGAKVVATGSVLTNGIFIAHGGGGPISDPKYALAFHVDTGTPGVKLISRASYELQAAATGSPFDYPLSSRFDENDSILVLDRALVPWENVLIYGNVELANAWVYASGAAPRMSFHGAVRLAVKLDFISGLLLKAVGLTGTKDFRGVQTKVGEVIGWRNLFWGLGEAMVRNPRPWVNGAVQPNDLYGHASRLFATEAYPAIRGIIEKTVGSGLIYLNSNAADFGREEIRGLLDKYVRGSGGASAQERVKLMKLLWDAVGSEFAGRHELYERNYLGNDEMVRMTPMFVAEQDGTADQLRGFADECMAQYDLDGWVDPRWVNPDDVSLIGEGQ